MKDLLLSMRPKQWIKNSFVLLPLLFGKKIFSYPENLHAFFAAICFILASSGAYLLNDVLDKEEDGKHPTKRLRPIAARKVPIFWALAACGILMISSLLISYILTPPLGAAVAAYLALSIAYSKFLKHRVLVDVFCIAGFFLLRLQAGSAASNVVLSPWILLMTFLLSLLLGFGKRRQEIRLSEKASSQRKVLEKYEPYFIDQMISVVTASICIVYAFYAIDRTTILRFGTDHLIYSIPFVYYGIFRYLYLIHKVGIDGDPTNMFLSDWQIRWSVISWIATCVLVIYFGL